MDLKYSASELEPWGIIPFDQAYTGLPKRVFNLLRTCNRDVSIATIGQFLITGIKRGQRVALISFDHPVYIFSIFKDYGFCFDDYLLSEELIYLYYKPCFSHSLNFATNYRQLFNEARSLSKGNVSRVAFLNADVLFNLETHLLAESSAQKIMASFSDQGCVVLGCYQATNTVAHQLLHDISNSLLRSYLDIQSKREGGVEKYELIVRKSPLFKPRESIDLTQILEAGFNIPNVGLIQYG